MLITEMILVALQSVRANLFRAFLTMLGIIIGVASVITMIAIGSGARAAVDEQIDALGASVLSVRAGSLMHMGVARSAATLTIDDATAIARDTPSVRAVVPEIGGQLQIKNGNRNESLRVVGVSANFADVLGHELASGRLFSNADDASRRTVAVLGSGVPAKLDSSSAAIVGQTIYIKGLAFEVAGVLAEKGASGFRNVDEQIWIPFYTARYRVYGTAQVDTISAQMAPGVSVERAIVEIERVMRRQHQILPGKDNDFSIADPRQFFNVREAAANIFAILLAGIASISLVVGGIGIMNIMLVTVTERTREIGIRKALGASRRNILLQFVIEAMVLCMLGGTVGILLGTGIAGLLAKFVGWNTQVSPAGHRAGLRLQRGRRPVFRHLAGPQGRAPRSDRGAALRVGANRHVAQYTRSLGACHAQPALADGCHAPRAVAARIPDGRCLRCLAGRTRRHGTGDAAFPAAQHQRLPAADPCAAAPVLAPRQSVT
jgi:putative ABC transport system permease protein